MRSLLSKASVAHSQMLLAAIPKTAMHKCQADAGKDTMCQIWKILAWSMEHLFYGKFPETDDLGNAWPPKSQRALNAGQQLHNGYKGIIFAITGDLEFYQNEMKLAGASHSSMCFNCRANTSDCPHNDYRLGAAWRGTKISHNGCCPTDHVISTVPGVNGYSFHYDCLHILEEGLTGHIIANIMFDMIVRAHFPGASQELRLKALFKRICQEYTELGVDSSNRIRKLGFSHFCNVKDKHGFFPDLSGYKARHIRYLVEPFVEICTEFNDATPYQKHRLDCINQLLHMYEAIEGFGLHLPAKASKAFQKHTNLCLLHYANLAKIYMSENRLQWNTIPKMHYAAHMPDQCAFLNCKFVATYTGETMVGFMSSIAHHCLNGTSPHMVPAKVAWRWRLAMHLRCSHGSFELEASEDED